MGIFTRFCDTNVIPTQYQKLKRMATARIIFDRKKTATSSKDKSPKKGLVQIEVLEHRKRKYISTGVKIYTDQWGGADRLVIKSAFSAEYNSTIRRVMGEVLDSVAKNTQNGKTDLSAIKKKHDEISLADWIHTLADKKRNFRRKSTIAAIKSAGNTIYRFMGNRPLEAISAASIETLRREMLQQGYASMSVNAVLSIVHTALRDAVKDGLLNSDPMNGIRLCGAKTKPRVFLSEEEVGRIEALRCKFKTAEIARKVFLLQCYTGMARADILTLTPDMVLHENGKHYISRPRHKTGINYRITLLPPAYEILKEFGFSAPDISKDSYQIHLAKIGKQANITKHLTSHVGRHTFATWALHHGVPIEILSRMLGHTNIQTTQIYAKILSQDVDEQFERLAHIKSGVQSHD